MIVTAAHCLCSLTSSQNTSIFFHLPHPDSTGAIIDIGPGGGGLQSRDFKLNGSFCGDGAQEPGNSAKDVAVVLLATAISPTDLPTLPAVYTLGDFTDRIFNHPFSQNPIFFQRPVQVVGFDGSIPAAPLRKVATVGELEFDNKNVFTTARIDPTGLTTFIVNTVTGLLGGADNPNSPGLWIHDPIDTVIPANRLILIRGDSGGPIMFVQNGTTQTVFGVHSQSWNQTKSWFGFVGAFNSWSPTWDNGAGNGAFVRQFLLDADGDGVSDAIDNCKPPRCNSQGTCFNPDQRDDDMDGIGDACDNCPAFICQGRGSNATTCANATQADFDRDGVGDACDLCPGKASSPFEPDQNHDGVGDSCDTCPSTTTGGGRRACKMDSDCAGKGVCLRSDIRGGRCTTTGTNAACSISIGFPCADCAEVGSWGACSEALESDTDGDGIGNRCDLCPLFSDANLQQNSNVPAEAREGAPALNDACDSSPVFTVRPAVEPGGATATRTLFTAFAGVGSDNAAPAPPFNNAPVGFRHCDCPQGADPDTCLANTCGTSLAAFNLPDTTPWRLITVGAAPAGSYSEAQISPSLDFRINDLIYVGGIDCSDPLPHQTRIINQNLPQTPIITPDRNLCRLGTGTGRLLSWQTNADILANRVASFTARMPSFSGEPQSAQLVRQTNGFFWSHGTMPNAFRAGTRDTTFNAQLREHYTHVATPSASTDVIVIPRILVREPIPGCLQCFKLFSSDWLKALVQPGRGLNVLRLLPRPFALYPDCTGAGTLCAIRQSTEPHIDLDLVFEPDARRTVLDPARTLMTPTESTPVYTARSGGFVAVSVPTSWSQLGSTIEALGDDESGKVAVMQTFATSSPDEGVTPFGGEGFVPSDREGARWIFSKLEQALYLVGGTRNGAPTSEIWRLDLPTATWKHVFLPLDRPQTSIGFVRATAYDAAAGKLLIVEDAPGAAPARNTRITAFDTRTDTSKISAILNLNAFTKFGLTATGDGTYVLVGSTATNWTAYRFQISAANKITWLGKRTGTGFVVADPLPWQEGPALFTKTGGDLGTTDLTASSFTPSGTPPELSVCDQPLVVSAPPPAVISTCHFPALKAPVPTSICGPINIDATAPADFPLGTTTIAWTLTDGLGNKATVSQTITAILGDDPTCCPAGTNVITGTPNNDNLVGTAGADCILGLGAQDTISGGGGDDFISGGDGNDTIDGGSGNDRIFGGTGQDTITGGTGNDSIDGGEGDDICRGGDGDDVIHGGSGQDQLFGESNNDRLFGDDGDDTLDGGPGNDQLNGGDLHDTCSGGSGTNTFTQCQTIR